jgi:DNA polymerase family B
MNPSDYGTIIATTVFQEFTKYIVDSNRRIFEIDALLDNIINKVRIPDPSELSRTNVKTIKGLKRVIGKSTYFFVDGELVLRKQEVQSKAFTKSKVDCEITKNFVTIDIETIKKDNRLSPYLICGYNGSDYITSYGSNDSKLFSNFLIALCKFFYKKGKKLIVFAHNFSGFDGFFLMKHLIKFGKVEPLIFNGKIISIKVKLNVEGYKNKTIEFRDSMLLLPVSLRKLCKSFQIIDSKGYFPIKFNNIYHKGNVPTFEYFKDISIIEYQLLVDNFNNKLWSFKDEAIKYCKLDCKILFEILTKFNELVFGEFKINVHKSLTLPSLAIRIFKTLFMPKDKLYQLHGKVEKNIRESYSGGAVDVYIPHNRKSICLNEYTTLYGYDVNALYPTVMANKSMPTGKPVAFTGNIRKIEVNAFGFFYCKITSPEYLEHPILQRRIKTVNGIRTVAGLGIWEGWIYSEEMDNAIKYGYQFEIIRGYLFEKTNIFKDYVKKMFELRSQYPKGDPMNDIAKLLNNSLYGKFGMKDEMTKAEVFTITNDVEQIEFDEMIDALGIEIQDLIKFDNNYIVITKNFVNLYYNEKLDMFHGSEVNVAIASAITAEARIFMSQFKNNPNFKLYYSDTDSIVTNKPLPDYLVGKELGQLKLEYVINKAVFLAPKVYGFITDTGEEIIKVKGLNKDIINKLGFKDLEALLIKDSSRIFTQEKWFKSIIEGNISIHDMIYTLKINSNKRQHA